MPRTSSLFRSVAALALSLFATSLVAGNAKLGPQVRSTLDSLPLSGSLTVVVSFQGSTLSSSQLDAVRALGINRGITFDGLPMMGIVATRAQVEKLAVMDGVRSIWLNDPLKFSNYEATQLTGVKRLRSDATMTYRNGGLPVSGKGVTVMINDSGVDGTHADIKYGTHLLQNVLGSTNLNAVSSLLPITYVEGVPNTDTNSGHGTHVAGIIGATGADSGGKYEGVAPGANLVGYGSGAALFVLDGIGGFNYAITHQFQYNIRVVSNSWGSTGAGFDPEDPINIASKAAYDRGITVLFAAGNEGPGESTHNPYAKAPWVISVAAGAKDGKLADFSSRGTKGVGGSFTTPDGASWTWEDRPTITAPGVNIISTRAVAPVSSLGAQDDAKFIEPAFLPFYTTMSGTSMATPHTAGIVALLLEANPRLSPADIKGILQQTATNMSGRESWEVGAGYVNAYAAVDRAFRTAAYGQTLNLTKTFNSGVDLSVSRSSFTVDYNPVTLVSNNRYPFTVGQGVSQLVAKINAYGLEGQTGNTVNLVLIAPDGTEYSSGISLLFPLYTDRTVVVDTPLPGAWTLELRGLRETSSNPTGGAALPESVSGTLAFKTLGGFTGLSDIAGTPAEGAIKMAVTERLVDGYSDGTYRPSSLICRAELARYTVMGDSVRQFLPLDGSRTFSDVQSTFLPYAEAVAAKGAALRNLSQNQGGVMLGNAGRFNPSGSVNKVDLAYTLVQSLGLQDQALAKNGQTLTVQYGSQRIPVEDSGLIPANLLGYVQFALDMNLINARFTVTQGPLDFQPVMHAYYDPQKNVTRGEYAAYADRFFNSFGQ